MPYPVYIIAILCHNCEERIGYACLAVYVYDNLSDITLNISHRLQ